MKIPTLQDEAFITSICRSILQHEKPVYLFGINKYAESIASVVKCEGFIDEFTTKSFHKDKPIIKNLSLVPEDAIVISCVIGNRPVSIRERLQKFTFTTIDYFSFNNNCNLPLAPIEFWEGFLPDYKENKIDYEKLYHAFADQISKDTFEKIINFRLSGNLSCMKGFEDIQYRQYFEEFLHLQEKGESFVDVGGFDGNTTLEFIKRCSEYKKIFFFEPDPQNLATAKQILKKHRDINYFQKGISNSKDYIGFENGLGASSKVSNNSSIIIEVDKLDNLVLDEVTFLKMDIEGSEGAALDGASRIIQQYRPRLAISVYHRGDDLRKIPLQVLAIRPDYKLFLRHYTEGLVETVCFFV